MTLFPKPLPFSISAATVLRRKESGYRLPFVVQVWSLYQQQPCHATTCCFSIEISRVLYLRAKKTFSQCAKRKMQHNIETQWRVTWLNIEHTHTESNREREKGGWCVEVHQYNSTRGDVLYWSNVNLYWIIRPSIDSHCSNTVHAWKTWKQNQLHLDVYICINPKWKQCKFVDAIISPVCLTF